jgi:O-antigen/teichoic acid export membrane protein
MTVLLAKNTFYLTLASVGQKLIAFVYFLFVARIMQPELTGQYFLSISLAMIFSVVADFGITSVVIREMAKAPEKTEHIFRHALAMKIPLLLIGYICAIGAAILFDYEREIIFLTIFSGTSLILDSVHLLFYGVLRGHQHLRVESIGMFVGQAITAFVGGLILWMNPSLILLMLALVTGSLFNVFLSGGALARRFGTRIFTPIWDYASLRTLMRMALPFALAAIFVKVYSYVDTLFISKLLGTTAVGLYSIAYKFTYAFQFLPLAFIAALYPSFSFAVAHDKQRLPHLFGRAMWYMMILSTPLALGIWLIADQAVLLAGNAYASAASVLSVLIFVLIPIFLDFPIGALLNACNRQTTKTTIMGVTMIINIVLNAWLIPLAGIVGAAIAALISFLFMFGIGLFFVPRLIPQFRFLPLLYDMSRIALSGILMLIVGIALKPFIGWIGVIPICAAVYLFSLFVTRVITFNDLRSFICDQKSEV